MYLSIYLFICLVYLPIISLLITPPPYLLTSLWRVIIAVYYIVVYFLWSLSRSRSKPVVLSNGAHSVDPLNIYLSMDGCVQGGGGGWEGEGVSFRSSTCFRLLFMVCLPLSLCLYITRFHCRVCYCSSVFVCLVMLLNQLSVWVSLPVHMTFWLAFPTLSVSVVPDLPLSICLFA